MSLKKDEKETVEGTLESSRIFFRFLFRDSF